jgi:hypothetical protein
LFYLANNTNYYEKKSAGLLKFSFNAENAGAENEKTPDFSGVLVFFKFLSACIDG